MVKWIMIALHCRKIEIKCKLIESGECSRFGLWWSSSSNQSVPGSVSCSWFQPKSRRTTPRLSTCSIAVLFHKQTAAEYKTSSPFQMFYLEISGPLSYHTALTYWYSFTFHSTLTSPLKLVCTCTVMKISHDNNEVFSIMLQCRLMHSLDQRASCFSPSCEESFLVPARCFLKCTAVGATVIVSMKC